MPCVSEVGDPPGLPVYPRNGDLKWKIWEATLQTLKFIGFMRMQLSKEQDFLVGKNGVASTPTDHHHEHVQFVKLQSLGCTSFLGPVWFGLVLGFVV